MKTACLILAGLSALAFVVAIVPKKNGAKRNIGFLILSAIFAIGLGSAFFFVI
jgi:hypothetical protein